MEKVGDRFEGKGEGGEGGARENSHNLDPPSLKRPLDSEAHSDTLPTHPHTHTPQDPFPEGPENPKKEPSSGSTEPSQATPSNSIVQLLGSVRSKAPPKSLTSRFGRGTPGATSGPPAKKARPAPQPLEGPSYKLAKVLVGHAGWVNCVAFDPQNAWFATGSNDTTIKVWDLQGRGKLTLTGHTMAVRALSLSNRAPHLYSGGLDRSLRQWDLATNQVVHHMHGHRTAITSLSASPTLDLVAAGTRGGAVHVWDVRSRTQVHTLRATDPVTQVLMRGTDPQLLSAGVSGVKLWDLRSGHVVNQLTSHVKEVAAVAATAQGLVSASADSVRRWTPQGDELEWWQCEGGSDAQGTSSSPSPAGGTYIHSLALSPQNVLAATRKDGLIALSDLKQSVRPYSLLASPSLPGSLESESPVLCSAFDMSGSRFVTGHADKSVRLWTSD